MKSSAKNVTLTSVDDLFTTEEQREDKKREKVRNIPLNELHPFRDHPFKVVDDEKMEETVESIREYGVLVPIIARPKEEGGYEIISGHRRCHASEKAGLETIPTIVRDLDDDEATIIMVDSNLQRESLLPSERAKAYKMKLDAIKHQGKRNDLTCTQNIRPQERSTMLQDGISKRRTLCMEQKSKQHLFQQIPSHKENRWLESGNRKMNAKSLLGIMSLGIVTGSKVNLSAVGPDAEAAVNALDTLLQRDVY